MSPTPSLSLCLYVAGTSPKSILAINNLKKICDEHIPVNYELEVVDLTVDPSKATGAHIHVLPTLVRQHPKPVKKVVGDLSNIQEVLIEFDLQPQEAPGSKDERTPSV